MFEKITGIIREWKRHSGSLVISVVVTLVALAVYYFVFLGELRAPLADFIMRLELDSLDTRIRTRGRVHPDSRIVIVDIDQRSQEALGQWPFPRIYFAKMLDALHDDGARVVAFDITFSKPDATSLPLRTLLEGLSKGQTASAEVQQKIAELEKQYDYDQQLADAIKRFGKVVLGNYFLYTSADLAGSFARSARPLRESDFIFSVSAGSRAAFGGRIRRLCPPDSEFRRSRICCRRGAEANTETFTGALSGDKAGCGFFNIVSDPDGVVRRSLLALPYGRDANRANWDLYASLDVQTLRLYLGLPNEKTVLNFGGAGIASIEFGPDLVVHPDDVGRMMINYQGPPRTYPYVSFADVVQHRFSGRAFRDKIVLVGASATGIGDLRATPFGGVDFPGVEIHANVIDNILNRHFLRARLATKR